MSKYHVIFDQTMANCRQHAIEICETIARTNLVIAEARKKIARDAAEDKRLLDLVATHSDQTNTKGRA